MASLSCPRFRPSALRLGFTLLVLAGPAWASGPAWPPVPPEVWAMKEATLPGGQGAMVLLKQIVVGAEVDQYHLRVRICSERGRNAAEFSPFPDATFDFEGRVVYPDGRVVPIQSSRDFHIRTLAATRKDKLSGHVLVAPGITDDCLLDLRWKVRSAIKDQDFIYKPALSWILQGPYPIQLLEASLDRQAEFSVLFRPGRFKVEQVDQDKQTTYRLRDLPARESVPFTYADAQDLPRLQVYNNVYLINYFRWKGIKAPFWDALLGYRYKPRFVTALFRTKRYQAFSEQIRQGLAGGPQAGARELASRLHERIRNLDELDPAELAKLSPAKGGPEPQAKDLDATVARGATDAQGMVVLYLDLLKDAGIPASLGFVSDRTEHAFDMNQMNWHQLDAQVVLVREPGRPALVVQPGRAFLPPGLVEPCYLGTSALEVDPAAWTAAPLRIPAGSPGDARRTDAYDLEVLPDQDRIALTVTCEGLEAFLEREELRGQAPDQQSRSVRERLAEDHPDTAIDRVEVRDAAQPRQPLGWTVAARAERFGGRRRTVPLFPLTPPALDLPTNLADTRRERITLAYTREREASSRVKLPAGYATKDLPSFQRSNAFGSVALEARQEGDQVTARLTVKVATLQAQPSAWPAFKEFLGWIGEATSASLLLERTSK